MSQDVTNCPRCARPTPAARGDCIYCGEPLPFSRIQSAPPQRNIDTYENAFNTVLEPSAARLNETVEAALAAALQIELAEARAMTAVGKLVPLARSQTRQEAEMIAALVRTCGLRASLVPDEELRLDRELMRARRLTINSDEIRVHHSGGAVSMRKSDVRLLVVGELRNRRIDYTEGISGMRSQSGNVLDTAEYSSEETLLDLYGSVIESSFRIKSDAFDYSGLVSPLVFRAEVNLRSAISRLRAELPNLIVDDDFPRLRALLARAWPERTRNESRGIKRGGLGFRATAHASVLSDNRDQFERYSRLMFHAQLRREN